MNELIANATIYALKSGCFFPALPIQPGDSVETMIRKGALRHLHDVIAAVSKAQEA